MNQKTIISIATAAVLLLGIALAFSAGEEKPDDLGRESTADTPTYEPILYPGSSNEEGIDLRSHPIVVINFNGNELEGGVDIESLEKLSDHSWYEDKVYLRDEGSLYFFYDSYQLNSDEDSVTLIVLPYDPASFQELEYDYFKDKSGVYYFDSSELVKRDPGLPLELADKPSVAFEKLEGVDIDTASTLSRDVSEGARGINSSLSRVDFITDDESVYFKSSRVAPKQDFAFIRWQERDNVYITNYFQTDGRVFCQNKGGGIEELPSNAESFTPRLIYHQTFYASDGERFFIDCEVLSGSEGNPVAPEQVRFKPVFSDGERSMQVDLYIVVNDDIYSSDGALFATDVKNVNSLKHIGYIGGRGGMSYRLMALDSRVYSLHSYGPGKVGVLNSGQPVDLDTLEKIESFVLKDKNRVYMLSSDASYSKTFVPEDVESFEAVGCGFYADKFNVYKDTRNSPGEEHGIEVLEGVEPSTLEDATSETYQNLTACMEDWG